MLTMPDVARRLGDVKEKTTAALLASEADRGASVVLVAVVREFDVKTDKAMRGATDDGSARDSVIELEQAGTARRRPPRRTQSWAMPPGTLSSPHISRFCILKTEV